MIKVWIEDTFWFDCKLEGVKSDLPPWGAILPFYGYAKFLAFLKLPNDQHDLELLDEFP